MRQRSDVPIGVLAFGLAVTLLSSVVGAGQSDYTPPTTPWGDPDLRGHYLANYGGQLEVPSGERVDPVYPASRRSLFSVLPAGTKRSPASRPKYSAAADGG